MTWETITPELKFCFIMMVVFAFAIVFCLCKEMIESEEAFSKYEEELQEYWKLRKELNELKRY